MSYNPYLVSTHALSLSCSLALSILLSIAHSHSLSLLLCFALCHIRFVLLLRHSVHDWLLVCSVRGQRLTYYIY